MTDFPYPWVPLVIAGAFVVGAVVNGVRFATGGKPSHAVAVLLYLLLALIMGSVAWMAWFGPPSV